MFPQLLRETTLAMKGVAIISIALHNLLHLKSFGFIPENEVSFKSEYFRLYIDSLFHLSPNIVGDTLSFLGWLGVPVFVFLSGYGLVMKFEKGNNQEGFVIRKHLRHSFFNLFFLILPAITLLLIGDIIDYNKYGIATKLFSLTLLTNVFSFIIPYPIIVYWYAGFTFELYLLYIIFNKNRSGHLLLYSSLICFLVLFLIYFLGNYGHLLHYLKDNFVGWLPIFCLGIYVARNSKRNSSSRKGMLCIVLLIPLLFITLVLMNSNYFLWVLMPFFAIPLCICIVKLIQTTKLTKKCFIWIGEYSAAIFMVHPLIRMLNLTQISDNLCFIVVLYLFLTLLFSYFYQKIVLFLRSKIIS